MILARQCTIGQSQANPHTIDIKLKKILLLESKEGTADGSIQTTSFPAWLHKYEAEAPTPPSDSSTPEMQSDEVIKYHRETLTGDQSL
ncbi:hypothetical protein CEXT_392121 [Caerostris extrusa]|uniref:Uncharacterized protein n=1 Tax=Caerostris extrusa TaxID=172846 RepID=A0AAV4NYU6_CAEEX|nr:hypothetical protein CEXT_392121 [Caerostris extrusa]